MIVIKELLDEDLIKAIKLKILCQPEELAGMSDRKPDEDEEYAFWFDWMHTGMENGDVRTLIGAFEGDRMLGVAFASFAEKEDSESGAELNGLWVHPDARGKGISLILVTKLLDYYKTLGMKEIVVYSFHNSPSNSFYRKFGAEVFRTELQTKERIPADVFRCDIEGMKERMEESVKKYNV